MTRRRKGKTGRDTPQADPTSEITAAVAHTLNSLEALTEKCRDHGIDPMTTIMSVMSRMRSSQPAIEPVAASAWAATHANIVQRSRAFVEALDRADVEAVEAVLAPGFIHVVGRNVADRETSLSRMRQRTEKVPYFAERTWENETVTPNGDAVVFNAGLSGGTLDDSERVARQSTPSCWASTSGHSSRQEGTRISTGRSSRRTCLTDCSDSRSMRRRACRATS